MGAHVQAASTKSDSVDTLPSIPVLPVDSGELRVWNPIFEVDQVISTEGISYEKLNTGSEKECLIRCLNRPGCGTVNVRNMTDKGKACELLEVAVGDPVTILPEKHSLILGKYIDGFGWHLITVNRAMTKYKQGTIHRIKANC